MPSSMFSNSGKTVLLIKDLQRLLDEGSFQAAGPNLLLPYDASRDLPCILLPLLSRLTCQLCERTDAYAFASIFAHDFQM